MIVGGESGFGACLGGYRSSAGQFFELSKAGLYWTASDYQYSDLGNSQPLYTREIKTAWIYYFYLMAGVPELRRDFKFLNGRTLIREAAGSLCAA